MKTDLYGAVSCKWTKGALWQSYTCLLW